MNIERRAKTVTENSLAIKNNLICSCDIKAVKKEGKNANKVCLHASDRDPGILP